MSALDLLPGQTLPDLPAMVQAVWPRAFENASCGLLNLDDRLDIVGINQTLLGWLGWERGEFEGLECGERRSFPALAGLLDQRSRDALMAHVQATRAATDLQTLRLRLFGKDGQFFTAEFRSLPEVDRQGRWQHTQTTVIDMTERAEVEHQLQARLELLQTITDRTPSRLAYFDKNLVCRFANAAYARDNGCKPEELMGSHISDALPGEHLLDILPRVAKVLSGEPHSHEAERVLPGGGTGFFEIHYLPDLQEGRVQGYFVEQIDITDRRRTEDFVCYANMDLEDRMAQRTAELLASEQRFRLMSDAILDCGIAFLEPDGRFNEWTDSAQRLFQRSRDATMGLPLATILPEHGSVDESGLLMEGARSGHAEHTGWALRSDGTRFWGRFTITALRDETHELQGFSCVVRDITEARRLSDLLEQSNAGLKAQVVEQSHQLINVNKQLEVFSHSIAHDIRAPLRHIGQFVHLIEDALDPHGDAQVLKHLGQVATASHRMGMMIEGLLEFTMLGRAPLDLGLVPLTPLVHGVVGHLKSSEQPGLHIHWVLDPHLPTVHADPILLGEVLGRLLDNAVKFTRRQVEPRIEVGAQPGAKGRAIFYVRDNGVGFDLDHARNLFVMFQRQHHSMDFEGVGTGLAVVHRIVERHGGRIWCETASGKGCTFFLDLPAPERPDACPDIPL